MPAYRWIVMCDGALSQRLVDYDFDHVSETQESRYVYENDDMSDIHQETVNCLKVPYTVNGTPMTGVLTVEDYDADNWEAQLASVRERQESLRSRTGTVDHGISVEESKDTNDTGSASDAMDISGDTSSDAADSAGTASSGSEETKVTKTDDPITANNALSEYLAAAMIGSAEKIDLSSFPEASDTSNVTDAWQEATYQNPLVLGVSDAYLSSDHRTLNVVYEDDAQTREKKQQQLRDAVKKINAQIIKDGMTDIEKEFAINEYLCRNGQYDDAALADAEKNDFRKVDEKYNDSFTAYGILINGVGVCSSYAPAFKLLADDAGLQSIIVTGYLDGTSPHEWNRVNLNGNGVQCC